MATAKRWKRQGCSTILSGQVDAAAFKDDCALVELAHSFALDPRQSRLKCRVEKRRQRGACVRSLERVMPAIAMSLFVLAGPAGSAECEQLPLPSVSVNRLDEPVVLDTTYSYKSLAILGASLARADNRVLGLTRGTARITFSVKTPSVIDRTGRWECSSPQLAVAYGFSPMVVYVAKEFPKGSCAYNEIYQHELRHVKAYQDHLVSIRSGLVDTLTSRFATGSPWRGAAGQTRMALERELNEQWMPYIRREIERVESAQALIDTAEEYTRVAQTCNGEIKRLGR